MALKGRTMSGIQKVTCKEGAAAMKEDSSRKVAGSNPGKFSQVLSSLCQIQHPFLHCIHEDLCTCEMFLIV